MTAPDPRLDEIQARLDVHVKCADCGKCRVSVTEEWCPECDYWACEGGLACADDPYPADVSYLLAELRKAHEALTRVEGLADDLATHSEGRALDFTDDDFDRGWHGANRLVVDQIRSAVAAANGDGQ